MLLVHAGVALVSASGIILQVTLTRVFSVTQWYHFAFMAVGLGLLGFGASGSLLTAFPRLRASPLLTAGWSAVLVVPATALAYLALAVVPFDAYLMALQPVQFFYLAVQVGALVVPFLLVGIVVGALLAAFPERAGTLYAASFLGAGAGSLIALGLLSALRPSGVLIAASAFAAGGGLFLWGPERRLGLLLTVVLTVAALASPIWIPDLPLSPYKGLSQILRLPDARIVHSAWNATSRVDLVRSGSLRSAPGLSYVFPGAAPTFPGFLVDGDNVRVLPTAGDRGFTAYLPTAVAYYGAAGKTLIVGTGIDLLAALHHRARPIVLIEPNPLVARTVERVAPEFSGGRGEVRVAVEHVRAFLRRTPERFDLIQVSSQESFQVVASGTFSLTEHYLYTVEAFLDYMRRLTPSGVLSVTRWLQTPPSEEVRVWTAAVEALRASEDDAGLPHRLIALRSLNTMTVLVKPSGFTATDVARIRAFADSRRFDLTYAPGLGDAAANRFNVLPRDVYREAFTSVLDPERAAAFLRAYPFEVAPVRDDRPFFFHFFRARQIPQILGSLGRTWQPFGGGGYLVLLALLGILTLLSAVLILWPIRRAPPSAGNGGPRAGGILAYFLALGLGYLFVEIPLLAQMILMLGSPTYAAAFVLATLLVASGAGSLLTGRVGRPSGVLLILGVLVMAATALLPTVLREGLGLPPIGRAVAASLVVLPLGVLMGVPFPAGIRSLGRTSPQRIPWAWAINGSASVVGSVLAALLQLEWGFRAVLFLGGLIYLVAAAAAPFLLLDSSTAAGPTGAPAGRT